MKTATDTPEDGKIVQTTTTRRILAADSSSKERSTPEFWEYLEKLPSTEWDRHIFYIYRDDPGPSMQVGKHTWQTCANDGIPWGDREDAEAGFAAKYGGKTFRVIVKRNSERITIGRIYVNAPPKPLTPTQEQPGGLTVMPMTEASATADVAKQAMTTIANQEQRAVAIGMDALNTAANVVQKFADKGAGQQDDFMRQAFAALIQRALEPVNPMAQLTQILALMRELGTTANPTGPANPTFSKIVDMAIEKLLNPPATGPGPVSAGAELVRQLPQVASYIGEAIREWRLGSEAQRDTAAMMRGIPRAPNAPGTPPGATPAGLPAAPPQNNPVSEGPPMGAPSLEFIESKIIEIFREPISADEAAEEVVIFLERMSPTLPKQLVASGDSNVMQLFQTRPTLRPATQNMPRLTEFIRAFFKYASENEAPDDASAKPN